MNATKVYCFVSGIVFTVIALAHLTRSLAGWSFVFGPYTIASVFSWIAFIGAGALAIWGLSRVSKSS
jgi:hypothetical protein